MFLAYTSRRHQQPRVRKLIDHLAAALAEMLESDAAGEQRAGPDLEASQQAALEMQ
jgi:hypothetical protein